MAYSDLDLARMTRAQAIACPMDVRLKWFRRLQAKHRELNSVTEDLLHLVHPENETRIVTLIGMTGIGKTTLATRILDTLLSRIWQTEMGPSDIPSIVIEAPANGERSLSWKTLYQRALVGANEILVEKKRHLNVSDNTVQFDSSKYSTLASLRESLESMLKHRNVRLLVIDEAFHLLRFESYAAVMDTLKSIANIHQTKLMLIGSYDLCDLAIEYAQVARRSEILHYRRYRKDVEDDVAEFKCAVEKLQQQWPCDEIPNFVAISEELMEATLGSIGLLKGLMLSALKMQLGAPGQRWTPKFLQKAAKSLGLLAKIRAETELGEARVESAAYGNSIFASADYLARIAVKMGAGNG